jgi:bacillithiol system protein YtxJ
LFLLYKFSLMKWIPLHTESQLMEIIERSSTIPQVIFKYSSRCSLSDLIRDRLERNSRLPQMDFYFLDLIAHRALSDMLARTFKVHHESPQVLVIRNGECIYDESHLGIRMDDIITAA